MILNNPRSHTSNPGILPFRPKLEFKRFQNPIREIVVWEMLIKDLDHELYTRVPCGMCIIPGHPEQHWPIYRLTCFPSFDESEEEFNTALRLSLVYHRMDREDNLIICDLLPFRVAVSVFLPVPDIVCEYLDDV